MKIEILNRYTSTLLYSTEAENIREAVVKAAEGAFHLRSADLRGANLRGANLECADLRGANLWGANLWGADLGDADLGDANLGDANLRGANLRSADLRGADLRGTALKGADLRGAHLRGANLGGANLGNQWIIQGGTRQDGYIFLLTSLTGEGVRLKAGCRNFTIAEARAHWIETRGGTPLGDESLALIDGLLAIAKIRGYEVE